MRHGGPWLHTWGTGLLPLSRTNSHKQVKKNENESFTTGYEGKMKTGDQEGGQRKAKKEENNNRVTMAQGKQYRDDAESKP